MFARLVMRGRMRFAAVLLATVTACQPAVVLPPLAQEEAFRLPPGRIGLTLAPAGADTAPTIPAPATAGEAAAKVAGKAAMGSALVGATLGGAAMGGATSSHGDNGYAEGAAVMLGLGMAAIGIVLAPVAALVGAGVGSAQALPAEEREADLAAMHRRLAAWRPGPDLLAAVAAAAPGRTVVCPAVADCPSADGQAPAAVLRLQPQPPAFAGDEGIDPQITLTLEVDADVLDPAGGRLLATRRWTAPARTRAFTELGSNDAASLGSELDAALADIAGQIARDVLLPPRPVDGAAGTPGPQATMIPGSGT